MTEYMAYVPMGVRPSYDLNVVMDSDGIATMRPCAAGYVLRFELVFPSTSARDDFMCSRRRRIDARVVFARLTLLTPHELLGQAEEVEEEQGRIVRLDDVVVARLLSVPTPILHTCVRHAWNAVLAWYQQRHV